MNHAVARLLLATCLVLHTSAAEALTNPPIKELTEGRLQIGAVIVDPKSKTITFPALVNMNTGMVEYLIVTTTGKVHESLLRTDAEPFHIHTAMLLLGFKPSTNSEPTAFFDTKREIPGRKVKIEVKTSAESSAAELIQTFLAFASSKARVKTNDIPAWIYNGSRFGVPAAPGTPPASTQPADGTPADAAQVFLAQKEGSIVSLIADSAALINNTRPDRENDELWTLHTPAIPPINTPVQVTITLL
jgi:hypothetical protein